MSAITPHPKPQHHQTRLGFSCHEQGSKPVCWAARRAAQNQSLWVHRKESEKPRRLGRLWAWTFWTRSNPTTEVKWRNMKRIWTKHSETTIIISWMDNVQLHLLPSLMNRESIKRLQKIVIESKCSTNGVTPKQHWNALSLHVGFQDLSDFISYQDSPTSTTQCPNNLIC